MGANAARRPLPACQKGKQEAARQVVEQPRIIAQLGSDGARADRTPDTPSQVRTTMPASRGTAAPVTRVADQFGRNRV